MIFSKVKLKELCVVNQGLQIPISKRFTESGPNRFFYITVQFLKENGDNYYIENPSPSVTCDIDDILVVRTGNTGQVLTGVKGCFHNNFFKVTPNDRIVKRYLYWCLNNKRMYKLMLNAASGTTIPDLKHSSFYDLEIPLFSIDNQKRIVKVLDSIDCKIKLNNAINNNLHEVISNLYSNYLNSCTESDTNYKAKDLLSFDSGVEPGSKNYETSNREGAIKFYRVGDMMAECNTYVDEELIKSYVEAAETLSVKSLQL